MKRFEQLKAWQACHQLSLEIYRITAGFCESDPVMTGEMRGEAMTAAVQISEGSVGPREEFPGRLEHATGALDRLAYLIRLLKDLNLITGTEATELEIARDHASKLTFGLRARLLKDVETKKGAPSGDPLQDT